jgi:uncharacterized RDD family membrane protein YckC
MPKCPKCQYFSFDSGDRCRNCGYDFSLALDLPADNDDLQIQSGAEPIGPLGDFTLNDTPGSLPLFTPGDPDAPLVPPGATPRAPLSVRRGAPAAGRPARPRPRGEPDQAPRLALDTGEMPIVAPRAHADAEAAADAENADADEAGTSRTAGLAARFGAAIIDLTLLGGIDLMVLYFTLKVLDLTFGDILLLPAAPLLSFLLLLDGGYLATFIAAGGQTIGKMATGIRVVPADPAAPVSERVTFGRAIVRTTGYFLLLAPLGLGFLSVCVGRQRRGLHDRLADTRVIRA